MPAYFESGFFVREPAWHGLGTVVAEHLNAEDAIKAAGLDWKIELHPVYAKVALGKGDNGEPTGKFKLAKDTYATVRMDTHEVLGTVGKRYHAIQNSDGFSVLDSIIGDSTAKFETAGSLHSGATVWMLARLTEDIFIAGEQVIPYFLCTTSHDGSSAMVIKPTPTRVVCANTLAMALKDANRAFRIAHTRSWESKIEQAKTVLQVTRKYMVDFKAQANALLEETYRRFQFEELARTLVTKPGEPATGRAKTMQDMEFEKIMSAYNANDLNDIRFTKWGAFNAVADYSDHHRAARGSDREKAETLFERTWDAEIKDKAFALLTVG